MQNGIFSTVTEEFVPILSRRDLSDPCVQNMLHDHHNRGGLLCGCGLDHGLCLPINARRLTNLYGDSYYTAVRLDVTQHAEDCFLSRPNDHDETKLCRRSDMFAPESVVGPNRYEHTGRETIHNGAGIKWDRFRSYARSMFSQGVAQAYLSKNLEKIKYSNSDVESVFSAIGSMINQTEFKDSLNGFTAAEKVGLRLRFGFTLDSLKNEEKIQPGLTLWSWPADCVWVPRLLRGTASLLEAAIKSVSIHGHPCTPPYFVMVLTTPDGELSRIYLHPIAIAPDYLIPVESAAERSFAQYLVRQGAAPIKPVRMEDTADLINKLGLGFASNAPWPFRPDFIVPWPSQGRQRLRVRELRGFLKGTNPIYDQLMDRKPGAYSKASEGDIRYKEIDGVKPPPCEETVRPEFWPNLRWRMPSKFTESMTIDVGTLRKTT